MILIIIIIIIIIVITKDKSFLAIDLPHPVLTTPLATTKRIHSQKDK